MNLKFLSAVGSNVVIYSKVLRHYWIWIFLIIACFFITQQIEALWPRFMNAQLHVPSMLLLAAVGQLFVWVSFVTLWYLLCHRVATCPISLVNCIFHLIIILVGKYLPGKIWGIIARGADLAQRGIDKSMITRITLIELYITLASASVICLIIAGILESQTGSWLIITGCILAILGFFGPICLEKALNLLANIKLNPKPLSFMDYNCGFLVACVGWLANGTVVFALAISFGLEAPSLDFWIIGVLAATVGIVAGLLAIFAPGGLGIREMGLITILNHQMSIADATLVAIIFRLWHITLDIILASFFIATRSAIKQSKHHSSSFDQ